MARFDVMTAEGDQNNDMSDTLRLSASGLNAVAIQINKQPIVTNQQGNVEAMVQLDDVVSFILNPRSIRDEKDCAAHTEEFWSMRFTVAFNGERDSVDKSKDDAKNQHQLRRIRSATKAKGNLPMPTQVIERH